MSMGLIPPRSTSIHNGQWVFHHFHAIVDFVRFVFWHLATFVYSHTSTQIPFKPTSEQQKTTLDFIWITCLVHSYLLQFHISTILDREFVKRSCNMLAELIFGVVRAIYLLTVSQGSAFMKFISKLNWFGGHKTWQILLNLCNMHISVAVNDRLSTSMTFS